MYSRGGHVIPPGEKTVERDSQLKEACSRFCKSEISQQDFERNLKSYGIDSKNYSIKTAIEHVERGEKEGFKKLYNTIIVNKTQ